jgi:hypothetical protein
MDRRMRADQQKFQPLVGEGGVRRRDLLGFGRELEERLASLPHLDMARRVDQAIARGVEQPSLGLGGHAVTGPAP